MLHIVFNSCMDTVTDSENFYVSLLDLLRDSAEKKDMHSLLQWWNRCDSQLQHCDYLFTISRCIFLLADPSTRRPIEGSALASIKRQRQLLQPKV